MIRVTSIAGWVAAGLGGLLTTGEALGRAEFVGLGGLIGGAATHSAAFGVSADGAVVVGQSAGPSGLEAFRWTERHGMQSLGALPAEAFTSNASAASADGSVIVGWLSTSAGPRAMRWTATTGMESLGYFLPGFGAPARASGVSADGSVIVGFLQSTAAFRWSASDGLQALDVPGAPHYMNGANGVSADGSVVVGGDGKAVRWTASEGVQPVGAFSVWTSHRALAVSGDGSTIIGSVTQTVPSSPSIESAFVWTANRGAWNLGGLPNQFFPAVVRPYAVNDDGTVVVGICDAGSGSPEAFLWTPASGMRSLRGILTTEYGLDVSGWSYLEPRGLSADGAVIVGLGITAQGVQEAWRARIPPLTPPPKCSGDANDDAVVNFDDITEVLANWGLICP